MTTSENELRKQRIIDAASSFFVQYRYDKTTVSDIARRAGVSKGAIYLHFDSKDALLEALFLRETQRYTQKWAELLEADPDGGRIGPMYKNILITLMDSPFMSAIFSQDNRVFGTYLRKPDNIFQKMRSAQTEQPRYRFVMMMQEAGAIRPELDPAVVAHIMTMLSYSLIVIGDILEPRFIPPLEDVFDGIADMLDRALTPKDGGNPEAGKEVIRQLQAGGQQQLEELQ